MAGPLQWHQSVIAFPDSAPLRHIPRVPRVRYPLPEIYEALIDSAAFVNWRRIELGDPPILALSYR